MRPDQQAQATYHAATRELAALAVEPHAVRAATRWTPSGRSTVATIVAVALVGIALLSFAPAGAASVVPRSFSSTFHHSWTISKPDQLIVLTSGVRFTCLNPTEANSYTAPRWTDTWSGKACSSYNARTLHVYKAKRDVRVQVIQNFETGTNLMYVTLSGYGRFRCYPATSTTKWGPANAWSQDIYTRLTPCLIG